MKLFSLQSIGILEIIEFKWYYFQFISAATGFAMSVARSKVITYSETITESYNTLFIKNPSGTFNFKAYFEPLKNMSWFLIVIFCILAPVSLFAISRFEHEPMKSEFTWVKSQIFVLSALTMKGWRVSPNQSSSRCAFTKSNFYKRTYSFLNWK